MYDENAALNHVKSLAFTRLAATDGEIKTTNYIRKELDKENIEINEESFKWTKTSSKLRKLIFLWIFIVLTIDEILLFIPTFTWIILPLYGLFFTGLILIGKIAYDYTKSIYIGKKKESKNIITTIQAKDLYPKRPVIIFSAHHDSVSSNFAYNMIKPLYISMILLFLSSLLLNLIISIWSIIVAFRTIQIDSVYIWIRNISLFIGIILLTEIFINFFSKKTNKSFGSIDNASGVSILIELAKLIKKNPLEKTDVIFLWCGAEEMGLWGSKQYCNNHFEELDYDYNLAKSYNINIDMVGTNTSIVYETGLIKKKNLNKDLNIVLEASAIQQKLLLKKTNLAFGTGSDHLTFRAFTKKAEKKDFQIGCFFSKDDSKFVHSKKDTPDKCSATYLNACIDICYNAIKSLDLRVDLSFQK
ncbi:MAG: M28 family metallopeptidase [Promethearchaeota archaeon]